MKNNLAEYVDNICENINNKIKTIDSVECHYELNSLIENINELSDKEKDEILEQLLNKFLELLKPIYTQEKYQKIAKKVDNITDYFLSNDDDNLVSDGDTIADDLIYKLVNYNGRKLNLPVKVEYIKEYSITSLVKDIELTKELIWIILRLATIYYCLENNI